MEARNDRLLSHFGVIPLGGQDSVPPLNKRKQDRDRPESRQRKKIFQDDIFFPPLRPTGKRAMSSAQRNHSNLRSAPDQGCHRPRPVRRRPESDRLEARRLSQEGCELNQVAPARTAGRVASECEAGRIEATVSGSRPQHRANSNERAAANADAPHKRPALQQDNSSDETISGDSNPSVKTLVKPEGIEASIDHFPSSSSADQVAHPAPDATDISTESISPQQFHALQSTVHANREEIKRLKEDIAQLLPLVGKVEDLTNRVNEYESRFKHAVCVLQGQTHSQQGA